MSKPAGQPLAIVAALLAISSPLYFARGIGIFDDSLYLKGGQLILDGLKPYRDFYDIKPPGIYYVSAAIAAVGGRGWLAPRIFLFLFAAAFQIILIRWVQQHFTTRAATMTALLVGLSYPLCQGYSLHTEPFGAAAAFAACALVLSERPSQRRWVAAGALLGLATAFKQTSALYAVAFGVFAIFDVRRRHEGVTRLGMTLASIAIGMIAAVAPIGIVFAAQGLGPVLLDSVLSGALIRADGAQASLRSVAETWVRCPALVAFLGVVFMLVVSRRARQVIDERRERAFVLFALVGGLSILPTLKLNGVGHYLQPGAFAFSVACALFLDAYLQKAPAVVPMRLVSAAAVALVAGYFVILCGGSALLLREDRLRGDLSLQAKLRQTLDTRLNPNETVLCLSTGSAARLYLMSGRRPFNRSLYYVPTTDWLFSLDDARRLLLDGRPPAALVDIDPGVERPELNEQELASLGATYEIIPLDAQSDHRLLALVRHDRHAARTATE